MTDTYHRDHLARLEAESAALHRQYRRAVDAKDEAATNIEAYALCDRANWLLHHHLGLEQTDLLEDRWFWLDGAAENWEVTLESPQTVWARGVIWCALSSQPGGRQWKEPFLARFTHHPLRAALDSYMVCLGRRSTLGDQEALCKMLYGSGVPEVGEGAAEVEWAFVFQEDQTRTNCFS